MSSDYIIRPGADPVLDIQGADLRVCPWAYVPLAITINILKILRYHFADPNRIENPNLLNHIYNNTGDRDSSLLWIGSLAEWNPRVTGNRPAILVERRDQKYLAEMRSFDDSIHVDLPKTQFNRLMEGMHTIHILGGRELEAEYLTYEVWRQISQFSSIIRSVCNLIYFLPMGITRRKRLSQEYKDHYTIQIPLSYRYQETWRLFRISGTTLPPNLFVL